MTKKDYFEIVKRRVLTSAYANYPCDCAINLSAELTDVLFCSKNFTVTNMIKIVESSLNNLRNDGYINLDYKDRFRLTAIVNLTEKGRLEAQEICAPRIIKLFNRINKNKFVSFIKPIVVVIISLIVKFIVDYIAINIQLVDIINIMKILY